MFPILAGTGVQRGRDLRLNSSREAQDALGSLLRPSTLHACALHAGKLTCMSGSCHHGARLQRSVQLFVGLRGEARRPPVGAPLRTARAAWRNEAPIEAANEGWGRPLTAPPRWGRIARGYGTRAGLTGPLSRARHSDKSNGVPRQRPQRREGLGRPQTAACR